MKRKSLVAEVTKAKKLRQRTKIDDLDLKRELKRLASLDLSQRQLSQALGMSQPNLCKLLKTASEIPSKRSGFSGADPYEICLRYSVNELERDELIEQLKRWDYAPSQTKEHNFFDDLRFQTPGSFDDVVRALDDGLIDDEIYDEVLSYLSVE